jgi:hypothetical protein
VLQHIAQTDEDQAVRRVATEAERKIEAHHGMIRGDMTDPSAACTRPRNPAETALPNTSALRRAGLTSSLCTTPRSRSQITAMP